MLWNLPQDSLAEKLGVAKKIVQKTQYTIMTNNFKFYAPMFIDVFVSPMLLVLCFE